MTNSSAPTAAPVEDAAILGIVSALGCTFTLIFVGYISKKLRFVSDNAGAGIGEFVGYIALPALLFSAIAQLDFSAVDLRLVLIIALGKGIVFVLGGIFGAVTGKRGVRLQKAGLFAIFATQSNDFAFGLPIVQVLYPALVPYLLLTAPAQLLVLNPLGILMVECGNARVVAAAAALTSAQLGSIEHAPQSGHEAHARCTLSECPKTSSVHAVFGVMRRIVSNPLVFMVVLGGAWNLAFRGVLPLFVADILNTAGSAFTSTALFCLGTALVGNAQTLRGRGILQPLILSLLKTLVLPLIVYQVSWSSFLIVHRHRVMRCRAALPPRLSCASPPAPALA